MSVECLSEPYKRICTADNERFGLLLSILDGLGGWLGPCRSQQSEPRCVIGSEWRCSPCVVTPQDQESECWSRSDLRLWGEKNNNNKNPEAGGQQGNQHGGLIMGFRAYLRSGSCWWLEVISDLHRAVSVLGTLINY